MDNQHKHIKGYRDLTQEEIDLMNEGKELAEQVGAWIEKLEMRYYNANNMTVSLTEAPDIEWVRTGKTQLQQGFMAAIRSIAKPTTF